MRVALLVLFAAACGGGGAPAAPDAKYSPWAAGPDLPEPLLEPGVATFDNQIWVIGGFDAGLEVTTDVWTLSDGATTWQPGPTAPIAFTHMNLAVFGGKLYLLGGLIGRELTPDGHAYVLADDHLSWTAIASMPAGLERGAAAVIVASDRIYIAGGADATDALGTVLTYTPSTDSWAQATDLPSPRSHPDGALAADGSPLVIGGLATLDASQPLDDVLALSSDGTTWNLRTPMPLRRGGCSSTVFGGLFYCIGGEAGNSVLRAAQTYDLANDTWSSYPDLMHGRGGTGGGNLGGKIYAPGGAHAYAYQPTADVDVLTP